MTSSHTKPDILTRVLNAVVVIVLVGFLYDAFKPAEIEKLVGSEAPHFALTALDETEVDIHDLRGRYVFLDFWAMWCPPCRKQMPILQSIATDSAYQDRVEILSINLDDVSPDRAEKVRQFLSRRQLTLTTLLDNGPVARRYKVASLPSLVIINPEGRVVHAATGLHQREALIQWLEP